MSNELETEEITPEVRQELIREFYSILADRAYNRREDLPEGIQKISFDEYSDMANVYKFGDKVIISYKGTTPTNLSDLRADAMLTVGLEQYDPKFIRALNLFEETRKTYPESQITLTGHSLGSVLGSHVSKHQRNTHSYGFNSGAILIDHSSPRATYFSSGDDSISKMTKFHRYGKYIEHNPVSETRKIIPLFNLVERHGLKNFLPLSQGGYNPDLNSHLRGDDFLKLTDEELSIDMIKPNITNPIPSSIDETLPSLIKEDLEPIREEPIREEPIPGLSLKATAYKEPISEMLIREMPIRDNNTHKQPQLTLVMLYNLYPNIPAKVIADAFMKADKNGDKLLNTEEYMIFLSILKVAN